MLMNAAEPKLAALKALREFTEKHRASIFDAGIYALDMLVDPSAGQRDAVLIVLCPRADSTRAATGFFATHISVVPIESLPDSEEMRTQLALTLSHVRSKSTDSDTAGAMLVVLLDSDSVTTNIVPLAFSLATAGLPPPGKRDGPWTSWLTKRLNEGEE